MSVESNRTLGGIGALMILVGSIFSLFNLVQYVFPAVSPVVTVFGGLLAILSFVGLIIFMIAMNGLANNYKDRGIFDNALYGLIVIIVGGVLAVATAVILVLSSIASMAVQLTNPSLDMESFLPTPNRFYNSCHSCSRRVRFGSRVVILARVQQACGEIAS